MPRISYNVKQLRDRKLHKVYLSEGGNNNRIVELDRFVQSNFSGDYVVKNCKTMHGVRIMCLLLDDSDWCLLRLGFPLYKYEYKGKRDWTRTKTPMGGNQ